MRMRAERGGKSFCEARSIDRAARSAPRFFTRGSRHAGVCYYAPVTPAPLQQSWPRRRERYVILLFFQYVAHAAQRCRAILCACSHARQCANAVRAAARTMQRDVCLLYTRASSHMRIVFRRRCPHVMSTAHMDGAFAPLRAASALRALMFICQVAVSAASCAEAARYQQTSRSVRGAQCSSPRDMPFYVTCAITQHDVFDRFARAYLQRRRGVLFSRAAILFMR